VDVISSVQPEELALSPAEAPAESRAEGCLEGLFRDHYAPLVGLLTRLTGDRSHAEEIAADAFSKLARRPALAEKREDATAWIYRVATNGGLDAVRANARRRKKEEAAHREQLRDGARPGALDMLLREERNARVRAVLTDLKPRDAQVLLLRSGGAAYREIAQATGVQPSSIGTILARAEREFERKYRARYGEDV
jgi:RNA polymerase sigma-70 factor (ECF subfamily)